MAKETCRTCGGLFWEHNGEWLCSACGRPRAIVRPPIPSSVPEKRRTGGDVRYR